MAWNFGKLLRTVEASIDPGRPAIIDADARRICRWGEFARQSRNLAAFLQLQGVQRGEKVVFYSRNRIEYLVSLAAAFKIGLVHVNVNFRYKNEELRYVFDNADAGIVFYASEFADSFGAIRHRLPDVRLLIEFTEERCLRRLDEGRVFRNIVAVDREDPVYSESPDDLFFMYTGGTTGMPKGVIWKHDKLFRVMGVSMMAKGGPRVPRDFADYQEILAETPGPRMLVNAPWMHSTGLYSALGCLLYGGTLVFNGEAGFSAERTWNAVAEHGIQVVNVTGDAMAKPLVDTLRSNPGRWDLSSLLLVSSAAMVFSVHLKRELIALIPQVTIYDALGASESSSVGGVMLNKDNIADYGDSAGFTLKANDSVRVFTEAMTEVVPGSGEVGMVATPEPIAEGYYKDPEKTASTFRWFNGQRYCVLGDYVEVLADGTIRFLGRGNVCINTGGEKVYPDEVESVLKRHPVVADCAVVGVSDVRWGSAVVAVVKPEPGRVVEADSLRDFVRGILSGYKVPKHVLVMENFARSANGKLDYVAFKAYAEEALNKTPTERGI